MKIDYPLPPLLPHHLESLLAILIRTRNDDTVVAAILGGSLVKGTSRPDSDLDLIFVLTPEWFAKRQAQRKLAECLTDGITYEHGYYDIKYVSREILEMSAERGSEPTRNAYVGARVVQSADDSLVDLVSRIGVYPEDERAERIETFHAGLILTSGYFWNEARKRGDTYLLTRTAADMVMYGLRMVLAHNRVLFPCHKWLTRAIRDCAEVPPGILVLADTLLTNRGDSDRVAFRDAILGWRDWEIKGDVLSRYIRDHETWWQRSGPFVHEW